jgi:SAM domain (Sterile alpha motif)
MDIGGWLRGLGLERYEQAFRENEIDLRVLRKLTADDLKELVGKGRDGAWLRVFSRYAAVLRRRWMTRRFAGTGPFEKRDQERPDNSPT